MLVACRKGIPVVVMPLSESLSVMTSSQSMGYHAPWPNKHPAVVAVLHVVEAGRSHRCDALVYALVAGADAAPLNGLFRRLRRG